MSVKILEQTVDRDIQKTRIQECKDRKFLLASKHPNHEEDVSMFNNNDESTIQDDGLVNKEYDIKTLDLNNYFGEIGLITNL